MESLRDKVKREIAETIWKYQDADISYGDFGKTLASDVEPMAQLVAQCAFDEADAICNTLDRLGMLSRNPNEILLHALENERVKNPPPSLYDSDFVESRELLWLFREFVIRNAVVWKNGAGNAGHPIWTAIADCLMTLEHEPDGTCGDVFEYLDGLNRQPLNQIRKRLGPNSRA